MEDLSQILKQISSSDLLGTNDPQLAKKLKKEGLIKRYKILEPAKVDKEIVKH